MITVLKRAALKIWKWLPLPSRCRWNIAWVLRQKFRVAVAAIILDEEGQLLLCEHSYRGYYPWGIPGGDLKAGEKPEDGVQREVREETGFEVEVLRPLVLYSASEYPHISLVFHCRILSGEFRPNLEITSLHFFAPNELPERILPSERDLLLQAMSLVEPEKGQCST